ncbi:MAG TPA: lasso peptide biosynthesis B2 protein [Candidatus Acidoferrales bacterium]
MTGAAQKWKTFWSLPSDERHVACSAAAGLAATCLGLRTLGFSRWQRILNRRAVRVESSNSSSESRSFAISANRIAQLQEAAALSLFFHTNCLERSLALWFLLRQRGFPAELKFGARKQSETFEAHAWVELNGVALNNPTAEQREFVPFDGAIASLETRAK